MALKTKIEPFRIKMVEPIYMSTEEERRKFLEEAHYNPFLLRGDQVIIDLLTDSGTSAMSSRQWAGMMEGDEAYAGSKSWYRMESVIKDLTGYPFVLPTHQGRAAERILYSHLGGKGKIFISNTHFDTTRANIEFSGGTAIDIPLDDELLSEEEYPFKGNMNIEKLVELIERYGEENIGAVILTVTNNSLGGQPVSMQNAAQVGRVCKAHGIYFILDCCRIAENAYYIKHRESEYSNYDYKQIARKMFDLADGAVMSAKKDALVNIGGFFALNDQKLAEECKNQLIITEGFSTYGGLAGRDMEALAAGLEEVFDPDYLQYRITSTKYLGDQLRKIGVPVVWPIGGHAVYVDAGAFYPHIPVEQFPGQALVCELYLTGGIRSVEIGSVMFGTKTPEGNFIPARKELVRLALPRRVYTKSHLDYIVEAFSVLKEKKENVLGFKISYEPEFLRHFTAQFKRADVEVPEAV